MAEKLKQSDIHDIDQNEMGLHEMLQIRGAVYDLLRRFFIEEPSQEYLKQCVACRVFETFPLQKQSTEIENGVYLIQEYFKHNDVLNDGDVFEKLHWDYTRMFIGPLSAPAPPWASYYLEKDKLLFQQTTLQIRQLYQKYGFIAGQRINSEADDHIGYELDFIYQLNQSCQERLSSKPDIDILPASPEVCENLLDQKNLITEHMLSFIPDFARAVQKSARTTFYQGMVQILAGFLPIDADVLKVLLYEAKKDFPRKHYNYGEV